MAGNPSKNLNPSGTFPTFPLLGPKDGEIWNEAGVVDGLFQKLVDAVGYLEAHTQANNAETRQQMRNGQPNASFAYNGAFSLWADASTASSMDFILDLPHNQELTVITAMVQGNSHSSLPSVMPVLALYRRLLTSPTLVLLGTVTDTAANHTAFDANHNIVLSGLTHTIDMDSYIYVARVTGESSTNSQNGFAITGLQASWIRTSFGND